MSYTYDANISSNAGENKRFKKTCFTLLGDLIGQRNNLDLRMSFIDLFQGVWDSEYDKGITFNKEGKYFIKGEHWFNIEDFQIDIKNNSFQFVKRYLNNPNNKLVNKLKVV